MKWDFSEQPLIDIRRTLARERNGSEFRPTRQLYRAGGSLSQVIAQLIYKMQIYCLVSSKVE